jgi:hypothetical protein
MNRRDIIKSVIAAGIAPALPPAIAPTGLVFDVPYSSSRLALLASFEGREYARRMARSLLRSEFDAFAQATICAVEKKHQRHWHGTLMVGRTTKPSAAQRRRLDAISKMVCVACSIAGQRQPNRTEVHHLVDRGSRRLSGGHDATIGLCGWHHRGAIPPRPKMQLARAPSMALQKRAFVERYGTERDMLAITDRKLLEVNHAA